MKLTPRVYRSVYYVANIAGAGALIADACESVVSSFGQGDDQWSGLDITDKGASVTLTYVHKSKLFRIEFRIPVLVPRGYWFSPYLSESVETFAPDGSTTGGEAHQWGLVRR